VSLLNETLVVGTLPQVWPAQPATRPVPATRREGSNAVGWARHNDHLVAEAAARNEVNLEDDRYHLPVSSF
jgi:hypothetical protein